MTADPNAIIVGPSYNYSVSKPSAGAAAPVAGLYANQAGTDAMEKTILVLQNVVLPLVDNAGVGAHTALKLYAFDLGAISVIGAVANLTVTKTSAGVVDTFNGDFGLGTVAADGSATLSSTEQNVLPTTATPAATAGVTTAKGTSTATLNVDGRSSAASLYLNMLVDDADQDVTTTPANLVVSGTITLTHANLGK